MALTPAAPLPPARMQASPPRLRRARGTPRKQRTKVARPLLSTSSVQLPRPELGIYSVSSLLSLVHTPCQRQGNRAQATMPSNSHSTQRSGACSQTLRVRESRTYRPLATRWRDVTPLPKTPRLMSCWALRHLILWQAPGKDIPSDPEGTTSSSSNHAPWLQNPTPRAAGSPERDLQPFPVSGQQPRWSTKAQQSPCLAWSPGFVPLSPV